MLYVYVDSIYCITAMLYLYIMMFIFVKHVFDVSTYLFILTALFRSIPLLQRRD